MSILSQAILLAANEAPFFFSKHPLHTEHAAIWSTSESGACIAVRASSIYLCARADDFGEDRDGVGLNNTLKYAVTCASEIRLNRHKDLPGCISSAKEQSQSNRARTIICITFTHQRWCQRHPRPRERRTSFDPQQPWVSRILYRTQHTGRESPGTGLNAKPSGLG